MLRRLVLVGGIATLVAGVSTFVGCGDSGTDAPADELADVVYEGESTDEALEALLAATPKQDAAQAATFTWPSDGDILEPDAVPTFCWVTGATAMRSAASPTRIGALEPPARSERAAPSTFDRAARLVLEPLLSGVRPAYAHGDPINGPAYFLVFSTDSNDKLLRVFTTLTDYTPDAAHWDTLKNAGAPITASVLWATFDSNRVATDGGPYEGTPITFTIRAN
ncbi:MAG TPA: hypothetical protein VL400_06925 [Polyangiaceae bacterium]|jgi:hypothetical protein|nr:hypothetical protein [Polyangiaceae bacterium]